MGMTLSQPIAQARQLVNDVAVVRYSAADMLRYANDCLREMAQKFAPQLFYAEGTFECVADKALQTLPFDGCLALVDVLRIHNGNALRKTADRTALDEFKPGWQSVASAAATEWIPDGNDPRRFYVNPPAPSGQVLDVKYVESPTEYASGDDTGLPLSMIPVVADYVAGRSQMRDEEYAQGASNEFLAAFVSRFQ